VTDAYRVIAPKSLVALLTGTAVTEISGTPVDTG
jgi:hypothetical protein